MSTGISMDRVDQIIDSYGCQRHHLIAIMQDIQAEYKYLSPEVLERIAEKLDVGVAKVYSVATFYENFSLEAKGKYIIKVCDGTACHVRKSQPIYTAIRSTWSWRASKRPPPTGCSPWRPWPAWAPAGWPQWSPSTTKSIPK